MRENASLHLPPEAGVDLVISGELSSAAGESFGFVEATEGAELAAEQAHVRSEETILLAPRARHTGSGGDRRPLGDLPPCARSRPIESPRSGVRRALAGARSNP